MNFVVMAANAMRSSKKPGVSLDEKDANEVQDDYFSQLESEGLL